LDVSGGGVKGALADALVCGRGGALSVSSPEERVFSWASDDGAWRVPAEWGAPQGVSQTVRPTGAKDFPDAQAQWIWAGSPMPPSRVGTAWFRATFSLAADTPVRVFATADDTLELAIDGAVVISHDALGEWQNTHSWNGDLSAGAHVVAAKVVNAPRSPGSNAAGLLCAVYSVDDAGENSVLLRRTDTVSWQVRTDDNGAPGWHAAGIVKALVAEAQARGVTAL
jgi:hypothetical protein